MRQLLVLPLQSHRPANATMVTIWGDKGKNAGEFRMAFPVVSHHLFNDFSIDETNTRAMCVFSNSFNTSAYKNTAHFSSKTQTNQASSVSEMFPPYCCSLWIQHY